MVSLIDATASCLTVSWPATPGADRYVLQYRKGKDGEFETLSDQLATTLVRKRNLVDSTRTGFTFRVGSATDGSTDGVSSWVTHSDPFYLLSQEEQDSRMKPPSVVSDGNRALHVSWQTVHDTSSYELQMRENEGGSKWETIASSLSGTEVRKKNLKSNSGYQFRVRPNHGEIDTTSGFSSPSETAVAMGLSNGMKSLFNGLETDSLVRGPSLTKVELEDALGGKEFVLLYASAHWCPPCRKFTPMLINWYNSPSVKKHAEVVFLSADHDAGSFGKYFAGMPWLAVDFDDDVREKLLAHIRVTGVPRLVVLDGKTGRIIEDNAVGEQLDFARWRRLAVAK